MSHVRHPPSRSGAGRTRRRHRGVHRDPGAGERVWSAGEDQAWERRVERSAGRRERMNSRLRGYNFTLSASADTNSADGKAAAGDSGGRPFFSAIPARGVILSGGAGRVPARDGWRRPKNLVAPEQDPDRRSSAVGSRARPSAGRGATRFFGRAQGVVRVRVAGARSLRMTAVCRSRRRGRSVYSPVATPLNPPGAPPARGGSADTGRWCGGGCGRRARPSAA